MSATTTEGSGVAAGRLDSLDSLRAVAVVLVILHHWGLGFPGSAPARLAARSGWVGVDLFFVLSGFLVSGLLIREHRRRASVDGGRFLVRRGLKIYPAFFFFLFVCLLDTHHLQTAGGQGSTLSRLLSEMFFIQNYRLGIWGHTWSLAIEEHFYLLLTLVVVVAAKKRWLNGDIRRIAIVTAAVLAICLAGRISFALAGDSTWQHVYAPTHLRIDSLFFGVFLAYCYEYRGDALGAWVRARRNMILVVSAVLVSTCVLFQRTNPVEYTIGLTALAFGFGGILLVAVYSEPRSRILKRSVGLSSSIGRYSYSIYLWHAAVMVYVGLAFQRWMPSAGAWPLLLAYLVSSVAVGAAIARIIEFPVLRVRDRMFPSRSTALTPHTEPERSRNSDTAALALPRIVPALPTD